VVKRHTAARCILYSTFSSRSLDRAERERIVLRMKRKLPRNGKVRQQSPRAAKSASTGPRGAGRRTSHGRWQVAKNVYGVIFLVVVIYMGINLLRG
jgi:hypothetical protein